MTLIKVFIKIHHLDCFLIEMFWLNAAGNDNLELLSGVDCLLDCCCFEKNFNFLSIELSTFVRWYPYLYCSAMIPSIYWDDIFCFSVSFLSTSFRRLENIYLSPFPLTLPPSSLLLLYKAIEFKFILIYFEGIVERWLTWELWSLQEFEEDEGRIIEDEGDG